MGDGGRRAGGVLVALALAAALGLAPDAGAQVMVRTISAGLSYENFSRTVVWGGDAEASKIGANLFTARADLGLDKGVIVGLNAGLALTGNEGLVFDVLPISLELGDKTLCGFSLGADVVAPVRKFSDFEISGTGRLVYSFGMSKTWTLEDFAVEGKARGEASWIEAAAGPRVSYLFFGRVVPYVEVWARWLHASFTMAETLADLSGRETRRVRGDFSFSVALGADADVSDRIAVRAKAAVLPYAGGADGLVAVGVLYKF